MLQLSEYRVKVGGGFLVNGYSASKGKSPSLSAARWKTTPLDWIGHFQTCSRKEK